MLTRRRDSVDAIIQRALTSTKESLVSADMEKRASRGNACVVPLAQELYKVAAELREARTNDVTYADVYAFARTMVEKGYV